MNKDKILEYHAQPQPGKISIKITKPAETAQDLSIAYSPGVAEPVREIAANKDNSFKYTNRGNLVGIISNGTAILGLGDLGALASKPVMEGKSLLFKKFADVDAYDIELETVKPDEIINAVKLMEPTFGGINLEDIKAPECFYIEEELKKQCKIPIFHDDQHGTAIVASAGLINALEINKKEISEIKVVFNGAGAAGIAIAKMFLNLGVKKENILMCDSQGVISTERKDLNKYKLEFAQVTKLKTMADALTGADVFVGVSVKDVLIPEMLKSMKSQPIVFALANPDPEITYELAKQTCSDVIMATGRSDYPNQINNVLGFPFIFRGALDVQASQITENMKMAAAKSLADLAKEPVPDSVKNAYGGQDFSFGPDYIIPKPFDPRIIEWEAIAVARAAVEDGVAAKKITDWEGYKNHLKKICNN